MEKGCSYLNSTANKYASPISVPSEAQSPKFMDTDCQATTLTAGIAEKKHGRTQSILYGMEVDTLFQS